MGGRGGSPNPGPQAPAAVPTAAGSSASSEDQIVHDITEALLNRTFKNAGGQDITIDIASVSTLRSQLGNLGWSRARQVEVITRMAREHKIVLIPESNQKSLTPRQREDAIRLGGQDKHLIARGSQWGR